MIESREETTRSLTDRAENSVLRTDFFFIRTNVLVTEMSFPDLSSLGNVAPTVYGVLGAFDGSAFETQLSW